MKMNNKTFYSILFCILFLLTSTLLYRYFSPGKHEKEIAILQSEVSRTCKEAEKYWTIYKNKYPNHSGQPSHPKALDSIEWKTLVGWDQACDTARADLEWAMK